MSDPKLISPMLDDFLMGDPISDHAGVRCCPAMKKDTDERYIVKIISNPASQQRLEALLLTGAYPDAQSANVYFKEMADSVVDEVNTLARLSEVGGFTAFIDHQIVPMDEGENGYDVYLLSDYRRSLQRQFVRAPLTHLGAVNLGLDICSALSVCRRAGYLYADLKPSNIFVVGDKEYKIGDLGFVNLNSLKYASLPDKYRSQYTAPEIADAFACLNTTIDIYALGLILYQAYNGGNLPFSGELAPAEQFPAPEYADYEMAEIILKACHPDPEQRWQDPQQMGQALVTYMQRNSVNDTPIVPPVIPVQNSDEFAETTVESETDNISKPTLEETDDDGISSDNEAVTEVDIAQCDEDIVMEQSESEDESTEYIIPPETEIVYSEDDFGNLSFLDITEDETTQELDAAQIEYAEVSDEVSEMMMQIDEIAAHQVPDPVVAPDPIDVPIPEPIIIPESQEVNDQVVEETETISSTEDDTPQTDSVEENASDPSQPTESSEQECEQQEDPVDNANEYEEDLYDEYQKPKKHTVRNIIFIVLALGVIVSGILFYKLFYLQSIDAMIITGSENTMSVSIQTKTDERLLTIVSTSSSGDRIVMPVKNGKAEFSDLIAGEEYTVTVEIAGFHKLQGAKQKTYYTPKSTNIMQITANTGKEPGSVVISFLAEGKLPEQWQASYSTGAEPAKTVTFNGTSVTLSDLTVGSTYKIQIAPLENIYLVGEQEITYTAQNPILAENLTVSGFKDGKLTVNWSAPEGAAGTSWTVHCYNDSGYNETRVTDQTAYTFENIDVTKDYFVEVSAVGHKSVQTTSVKESSIIIEAPEVTENEHGQVVMHWTGDTIPDDGWIVTYGITGTDIKNSLTCESNECVIKDTIPGQNYSISIQATNDIPVICPSITYQTESAQDFTGNFSGATVNKSNLRLTMHKAPEGDNWDYYDLKNSPKSSTFSVGESAAFLMDVLVYYGPNSDVVSVLVVYEDANGVPVSIEQSEMIWEDMWNPIYHGILNLPALPSVSGNYTVSVYFNGGLVDLQSFTVS